MARTQRVPLVCPLSPERLGAPLLGLQYVAAALLSCWSSSCRGVRRRLPIGR